MGALKLKEYLPNYTYDNYVEWEGRWEVIDGVPYAMSPMPMWKHQRINGLLFMEFQQKLKNCKRCKASMPVDWEVDKNTIIQPDNLIVCDPPSDFVKLTKTPALVVEILSPSTALKDKNLKYRIYEEAKVKYFFLVDPDRLSAEVYELQDDRYILLGEFDSSGSCDLSLEIDSDSFCEFRLDFAEVFDL